MAFDSLSNRLNQALRDISGKGKLTEKNMDDMLREIRLALLEADVNYGVVKEFLTKVRDQAEGTKVLESVEPAQMLVKIVHDEIVELLGTNESGLNMAEKGPTVVMMVGLQGTGKTTSVAKIANLFAKKQQKKVLMVACDIIRPAAIDQLVTLGQDIGVEVFTKGVETPAVETAKLAVAYAQEQHFDLVLIDTAGRLHIDEALMKELQEIQTAVHPQDILLTVDAMTGQDIVTVAKSFHEQLQVTGLVVTKFDGDARGGGVLSVRSITGVPVKFVGQGEKMEDLDIFYPDRMADRILGMGDIVTLVEQAQEKMDMEASEEIAQRMMDGTFTMDDMLTQLEQVSKMGPLGNLMKMIPGMGQMAESIDEVKAGDSLKKTKAIIHSMTREERFDPSILNSRRKNRIAKGSGTTPQEVAKIVNQFEKMKKMMESFGRMKKPDIDPDSVDMDQIEALMKKMSK